MEIIVEFFVLNMRVSDVECGSKRQGTSEKDVRIRGSKHRDTRMVRMWDADGHEWIR